jgi:Tfp pilus assembly protein PilE
MGEIRKNEAGFSPVEVIIVLIIVALIGVVGWFVYKSQHKAAVATTSTATKAVPANPYVGWKTYCDSTTKDCFKYPNTWTLNTGTSINTAVVGPSKAVSVEYSNPSSANVGGPQTFHTTSLTPLATANSTLKVIGGYYPATNVPEYALMDSSLIQSYSLLVGKTSENVGYLDYKSKGGTASLTASLHGADSAPSSPSPVDSWFSSTDAKTALMILQSFYAQQ